MAQITVQNLTFSYDTAYDNIFENANFQFDTDWKLGFIGRNGRGKTTFLKLLTGVYEYRGHIISNVTFDYFPFEVHGMERETKDIVKEIIAPFTEWEKEMEECIHITSEKQNHESNLAMERYGELQELYQSHDGYIIDELIEKEIGKLAVDISVLERPFHTLSYGERTKLMLAALFLKKNNFLLIDEPTNHLDEEGREVLAGYLQSKSGFILVSHDRAFIDRSVDHILSINKATIEVQKGNFSSWYENKEMQDQFELDKNEQLKKDIVSLESSRRRMVGWSDAIEGSKIGSHVFDRGFIGHKSAKMMKRVKSVEHRMENAIEEKRGLLKNIEQVDALRMNPIDFYKRILISGQDLSLFYGERKIIKDLNFQIDQGDRIAIRGKNGSGKTTLIKLLLGEDISYTGQYAVAKGLQISYVSQDTSYLEGDLKDFAWKYGLDETIFKTVLRQLDFTRGQFEKDMKEFSGGQKKKVLLAKSLAEPAHLYIWDEPLNFIDVYSRIQIENLIKEYNPTILFVEHDKVFTEHVASKNLII